MVYVNLLIAITYWHGFVNYNFSFKSKFKNYFMPINLLERVQENLHYAPLQKIDPNKHSGSVDATAFGNTQFSQAAVPAMLIGLYKYSTTDEGAAEILRGDTATNWVSKIFDETKRAVVETIASYVDQPKVTSYNQMNTIADEAVKLTHNELPKAATIKDVKTFFSNQVNNILPYLPAELHMGDFLNDTTLDDNTNKMEGPISSLMHSIGSAFSTPETEEDKHPNI